MPSQEIDFGPVTHITVDAIGKPGERVFYIHATHEDKTLCVLIEKVQIQTIALGVEEFLGEIAQRFPGLEEADREYDEEKMHITPPVDPLFRGGDIGLSYDPERDLIALLIRQALPEGMDEEESMVVRFWCTRSQVRRMSRWGIEVANRGRPICPQCGEPIEPGGHICPKKNGHRH